MGKAYIKDIAYYVPETIVTNEDIVREFPEWSVEKIALKVGVRQRHVAAADETAADLAVKAAQNLFERGKCEPRGVDFVLFCTQSPDYFLPTSACVIQERLGLRTDIGALDFNLGCSGYVYGLSLAKGLVMAGVAGNVLLLTGETYSKHLHPRDKGNRTIFGDAASATMVSADGIAGCPRRRDDLRFDENNNPISSDYLYMNGSEIFTFTLDNVPPLIADTLSKNNIGKGEVDLYVFHQANKYMLDFLRKKIRIAPDRFYYCLSEYGNTVSNTIPIALVNALRDGSITNGKSVLIAGFGVGYSWGGCLLRF